MNVLFRNYYASHAKACGVGVLKNGLIRFSLRLRIFDETIDGLSHTHGFDFVAAVYGPQFPSHGAVAMFKDIAYTFWVSFFRSYRFATFQSRHNCLLLML